MVLVCHKCHHATKFSNCIYQEQTSIYLPDPTENGQVVSPSGGLAIQWFFDNFLPRDILSEVDDDKDGVWKDDSETIPSESDTDSSPSDEDCWDTEDELLLKMC